MSIFFAVELRVVTGDGGDIIAAITERRQIDFDSIQPE